MAGLLQCQVHQAQSAWQSCHLPAQDEEWQELKGDLCQIVVESVLMFVHQVMQNEESPVEIVNKESKGVEGKDVSALLADLKEALAEVTNYDEEVYNDLDDNNPSDVRQKDRLPKENKSKYNIEQHSFRFQYT